MNIMLIRGLQHSLTIHSFSSCCLPNLGSPAKFRESSNLQHPLPVYVDERPTDDRPLISKITNGHISATDHPIHFMFGSRLGYSGTADLMAPLFSVQKIQDGGRHHLG